jgi:DNA-binding NarL/FixJ family response regulator
MKAARVLVADDFEVSRRGVRALLEARPGLEVCGEAVNGREAVDKARQLKPDVVVIDITMPELNGLDAARQIVKALPSTEVVILTMHESDELAREVLEAGVHGYVLKSDAGRELVAAIHSLTQHKPYFSPRVSQALFGKPELSPLNDLPTAGPRSRLTPRERQIVQLLAEGKSNKEAAGVLGISVKTVEAHRGNVMHKLNLRSFSELVRYAVRNKIVGA